ncbi:HAD family hydrolase [Pseudoxanthomonas sacheonensis]|uniref:HAD family hydrolase n=1 Tax=Pseudoxanthomonas sacheonensis TaxID=443615 RepID=UPI0013D14A75|nr:HAD family hydrolase [Pseudoxanthomonas sacheonensis]KAF1710168.1 hypothetical protein CSC73_05685 [Pseudoxanthomonas sacheonensis]
MGRPYRQELGELRLAQSSPPDTVVTALRAQASLAGAYGLIVVASGGAKVIAEWVCQLQRTFFGCAAVAMTPLQYASLAAPVHAVTWLVSASGRHPDIRHAASVAKSRGDSRVVAFIGRIGTPLAVWLQKELRSEVVEFDLKTEGDGFLATGSVWAMACALAKAYAPWLDLPQPLDDELCRHQLAWGAATAPSLAASLPSDHELIVLHDTWASLGVHDLETRFVETALGNLWSADFRNFSHGRHFWIADRGHRTSILALWTPASEELARPTLALIPASVPKQAIALPADGLLGSLAALSLSIHLTAEVAERVGRDPGRPGVPRFGEQLYEGGFPYPGTLQLQQAECAIRRKSPAILPGSDVHRLWLDAYLQARGRLETATVTAIVVDYDGTLVDSEKRYDPPQEEIVQELIRLLEAGVWLGVATGRGGSVQKDLRAVLPEPMWSRVRIGYHNGALIQTLQEDLPDLDGEPTLLPLSEACIILRAQLEAKGLATLRCRKHQITVTPAPGLSLEETWRATRETLDQHSLSAIQVWLSSHSVDVLGSQCSKIKVVEHVAALAGCPLDAVLRIGDRGAHPGNDWQLLSSPLGMSVGDCSSDMDTCWNILPPHLRGSAGTASLLRQVKTRS